jgi:copper chaperone CopZ
VTQTVTLPTSGMHCRSCSMLIEMNVGDLPGVTAVTADSADGTTVVTFDPAATDVDTIVAEIRKAGYDAEPPAE